MDDMIPAPTSPFEAIRHTDEAGAYWTARELMPTARIQQLAAV